MAKSHTINVRVYYKDTDAGGVVYHTRYAEFMEMARTELLRVVGMPVQELKEEYEVFTPVINLSLEYKKPAVYDDLLQIKVDVNEVTIDKLVLDYTIANQYGDLLCTASTTNCCVKAKSFSITNMPQELIEKLK
jgi:acyl-CoA thioester hydrolase